VNGFAREKALLAEPAARKPRFTPTARNTRIERKRVLNSLGEEKESREGEALSLKEGD